MKTKYASSAAGSWVSFALILSLAMAGSGCASYRAGPEGETLDPLEPINRPIYVFNDWLDRWLLRPVAKGYDTVAPKPVKYAVTNFFSNWATPVYVVNHVLQGSVGAAARQTARFAINTTLGLGGIIDAAQDANLPREDTGFGITLGKWGAGDGPYMMLPLFGPSNPRDAVGLFADRAIDPINNYKNASRRDKLRILRIIDRRRQLLSADKAVREAADPYIFVREAYLQMRRYRITGQQAEDDLDDFEAEFEQMLEEESAGGT
jgi:phospholipid-binding lipoprotein MlaA